MIGIIIIYHLFLSDLQDVGDLEQPYDGGVHSHGDTQL
jgi:hypothetical protein